MNYISFQNEDSMPVCVCIVCVYMHAYARVHMHVCVHMDACMGGWIHVTSIYKLYVKKWNSHVDVESKTLHKINTEHNLQI